VTFTIFIFRAGIRRKHNLEKPELFLADRGRSQTKPNIKLKSKIYEKNCCVKRCAQEGIHKLHHWDWVGG